MLNSFSKNLTWKLVSLAPVLCDLEDTPPAFWVSVFLSMKWGWMETGWTNNLADFPDMPFGAELTPRFWQYTVRNSFGLLPDKDDLGGLETDPCGASDAGARESEAWVWVLAWPLGDLEQISSLPWASCVSSLKKRHRLTLSIWRTVMLALGLWAPRVSSWSTGNPGSGLLPARHCEGRGKHTMW